MTPTLLVKDNKMTGLEALERMLESKYIEATYPNEVRVLRLTLANYETRCTCQGLSASGLSFGKGHAFDCAMIVANGRYIQMRDAERPPQPCKNYLCVNHTKPHPGGCEE